MLASLAVTASRALPTCTGEAARVCLSSLCFSLWFYMPLLLPSSDGDQLWGLHWLLPLVQGRPLREVPVEAALPCENRPSYYSITGLPARNTRRELNFIAGTAQVWPGRGGAAVPAKHPHRLCAGLCLLLWVCGLFCLNHLLLHLKHAVWSPGQLPLEQHVVTSGMVGLTLSPVDHFSLSLNFTS